MLVVTDTEKLRPHWDLGCQVKRMSRHSADGVRQRAFRPAGGIDDVPTEVGLFDGHHQLPRYPVGCREHCAQALVTGHDVGQRRAQRLGIKVPAQSQRHRHVVNR